MPTPELYNLANTVRAMKSAGLADETIVDRITSRDIDPKVKEVFLQAKSAGIQSKAVSDFLAHPALQQQESPKMETSGFLGKAARFVGVEPLGRFLGAQAAKLSPEHRKLLSELPQEEAERIGRGDVSGRELAGSVIQTGLSLATPFLGKALTTGTLGSRAASSAALGGAFGASGAMQDEKADILTGALTGALLGGAIPVAGAALKGAFRLTAKLPEKLYSQIFKKAEADIAEFMKTGGLQELQTKNPQRFQQLVEKGLIKVGESGAVEINPSLAREALDKGLRGTSEGMARYSYIKQLESEASVRDLVKGASMAIPNKKAYVSLLTQIKNEFSRIGEGFFSDRTNAAKTLIKEMGNLKSNKIPAETGLRLRRFLDDMRNSSSFRENVNLSQKQETFKNAANRLRSELANQIPGIKNQMNDYRIYIETFDEIVSDAVQRGNRRLLGLTDVLLGGGGMATGAPGGGLGAAAAVRAFQQPYALTNLGTAVEKGIVQPGRSLSGKILSPGARAVGRTLTGEAIAGSQ